MSFKSPPILLLGMHRSGTSATARILGMMGVWIGESESLLRAHASDNPTGYWEREDIMLAQHDFLQATGYQWDSLANFRAECTPADNQAELHNRLVPIIDQLDKKSPWLIKDPRLCVLLPLWQRILKSPIYVVVVRDPREIAASLLQGPRGTYTTHFLLALWEKYLRSALDALHGKTCLFVSYERLLANPKLESDRILSSLNALGVEGLRGVSLQQLDAFLNVNLRRSRGVAHAALNEAQDTLYAWLQAQCIAPGAVPVEEFPRASMPDAVLAEYAATIRYAQQKSTANAQQQILAIGTAHAEQLAQLQSSCDVANDIKIEGLHSTLLASYTNQFAQRESELTVRHACQLEEQNAQFEQKQAQLVSVHLRQLEDLQTEFAVSHDIQLKEFEISRAILAEKYATIKNQHVELKKELAHEILHRERWRECFTQAATEEQQQRRRADLGDAHHANLQSQLAQLTSHVQNLQDGLHAMQNSLAWRLTTPLRKVSEWLPPRLSYSTEQQLYRSFYALSGMSPARKRALVLWLHRRAPWLTRNTLSYLLYQKTREIRQPSANPDAAPRMDSARAETIIHALPSRPLISIVMPVYNVERRWLLLAVESVQRQFYPHWELCIADDASTHPDTRAALREIAAFGDKRIRMVKLKKNLGIAGCSNAALKLASGEYIGLLDNDDELTHDALLEVAQRIVAEQPDVIYSDEDKLEENGAHVEVHCKPDYSPDYFFSINYICHFAVIRRAHLASIGDFRDGFDGAQDYDLLLRATERSDKIVHIPKVLYHWRKIEGSTASTSTAKPKTTEAGKNALVESMQRRGIACEVELGPYPNTFRVRRTILGEPLVSILIPFREKPDLLDACVCSILEKTRYRNFEILCIDNGSVEPATLVTMRSLEQRDSRVRMLRYEAPFNYSAINNFGVTHARGEHILFLNNDTEVIRAEWLDSMLEHSQRPEVGMVGARLLYEDGTIQHAGVLVGPGGVAGHAHLFLPGDHPGYFARAQLVQNLSAVTFACAMTRRDVFEQVGGLNENELKIAFNDVDYCLRVREAGYLIVYTPYALLHHYESKSRGYEDTPEKQMRFSNEVRYMQKRHAAILERGDPYYNPQLSLSNTYHPDAGYAQELPVNS